MRCAPLLFDTTATAFASAPTMQIVQHVLICLRLICFGWVSRFVAVVSLGPPLLGWLHGSTPVRPGAMSSKSSSFQVASFQFKFSGFQAFELLNSQGFKHSSVQVLDQLNICTIRWRGDARGAERGGRLQEGHFCCFILLFYQRSVSIGTFYGADLFGDLLGPLFLVFWPLKLRAQNHSRPHRPLPASAANENQNNQRK